MLVFTWLNPGSFVVKSLTSIIGVFRRVELISGAVFKFPQSKPGKFDLKSAIHQTGAGLQVPVELEITFVDKVHSLKHKQAKITLSVKSQISGRLNGLTLTMS